MNEIYAEVREHLRQQHNANTQEIHGKKVDNFNKYRYYGNNGVEEIESIPMVSFKMKFLLFMSCVMLFSFYIYGGQDVEKGAKMAWSEMKTQVVKIEEEEPMVKQIMAYVRNACDEVRDFAKTYFNVGE